MQFCGQFCAQVPQPIHEPVISIAPGCRLLIAYGISLPENRAYSQIEIFYLGVFDLKDYPYIPCSSRIYIGQIRLLGEYHIYPFFLLIFRSGNGPLTKGVSFLYI